MINLDLQTSVQIGIPRSLIKRSFYLEVGLNPTSKDIHQVVERIKSVWKLSYYLGDLTRPLETIRYQYR
jgi:hypothetical protein